MGMPNGRSEMVKEWVDVVFSNVSFSIDLDCLDKFKMYVNSIEFFLVFQNLDLQVQYIRKTAIYTWHGKRIIQFFTTDLSC